MEAVKCLCGSYDLKPILRSKDYRFNTDNIEFEIVKCRKCRLEFLNPRPDEQEIKRYYPKSVEWEAKEQSQDEKFSIIKDFKGKILDIGCAKGEFLEFLKDKGYQVYGFEVSDDKEIAKNKGIPIKNPEDFKDNELDIVTMWQVIEHLHNPEQELRKINKVLKKDGHLIISTLNIDSPEARLFKKHWFHLDIPRHLYFFSAKTLKNLLESNGFKVIKTIHFSKQHSNAGPIFSLKNMLTRSNKKTEEKQTKKSKNNKVLYNLCSLVALPFSLLQALIRKGPIITIVAKKL